MEFLRINTLLPFRCVLLTNASTPNLSNQITGYTTVTGTSASEGEEEKQDGRYTVQKNIYVDGDGEVSLMFIYCFSLVRSKN